MGKPAGYADPAYAAALAELGTPRKLPLSGGSILIRSIPQTDGDADAMGPYPLFACAEWAALTDDVDALEGELVSLVLVPDPFGRWTPEQLDRCFPDVCRPFKEHYVVDLARPPLASATRHHRRDALRALRRSTVERVAEPATFLDEWDALYRTLLRRHGVEGPAAFSRASFVQQLAVPGIVAFRAARGGALLGGALWFVDRGVAHYHLAAQTDQGYREGVSYALVASALEHFAADGLEWAALGGGTASDGLARFKAGWSSGTRTAYLCGRILDRTRYAQLAAGASGSYFPAYRGG